MSIIIYPYKLTRNTLEARLPPGCSAMPGQWLRLEQTPPVYGQILEVFLVPSGVAGMPAGYGARIRLQGAISDLAPRQATLLSAAEITREIARLQGPLARPLPVSPDLAFDFDCLGPLTLLAGGDSVGRTAALRFLLPGLCAYRKVVIIDPLGLSALWGDGMVWKALREIRLSLRTVGDRRFLEAFGALFPERLRDVALRVMADYWPAATDDFIGFPPLSNLEAAVNLPLRNLILQHCREIVRTGVFAEHAGEVFHPSRLSSHPILVADLSPVGEPWRTIFYEQVLQACLEDPDCLPVLIEPEGHLPAESDWLDCVRKAQASGVSLFALTATPPSRTLTGLASNWIAVESGGAIRIQGRLTQGLPVRLEIPEVAMAVAPESRADMPERLSETASEAMSEIRPPASLSAEPDGELNVTTPASGPGEWESREWALQEWEPVESALHPDMLPLTWSVLPVVSPDPAQATGELERNAMAAEMEFPAEHRRIERSEGEEVVNRIETSPAYPEREVEREAVPEEEASLPAPSAEAVGDTAFLTLEGLHEIMASSETTVSLPEEAPDADKPRIESNEPMPQTLQSMVVPDSFQSIEQPIEQPIEPEAFQGEPDLSAPDTSEIVPDPEKMKGEMTGEAKEETAEAVHSAEVLHPAISSDLPAPDTPEIVSDPEEMTGEAKEETAEAVHSAEVLHPAISSDLPAPDTPEIAPDPEEMTGEAKEETAEVAHSAEVHPATPSEQAESLLINAETPVFNDVSDPEIPPQPEVPVSPPEALEEFCFELEPDGARVQEAENNGNGRGSLSSWGAAVSRPETDLTDAEMQEALDLIFPPYPDSDRPVEQPMDQPAATETAMQNALSEPQTPAAQSEPEPIPVLPAQTDDASPAEPCGFRVGDRVAHPTYGAGVIQRMIPMEDSVILNITFDRVGKRLLDPALCPALSLERS